MTKKSIFILQLFLIANAALLNAQPYNFGNWTLNHTGIWPGGAGISLTGGTETFGIGSTDGQVSLQIDGGFRQYEPGQVNYFMDKVGIGTNSPTARLEVAQTGTAIFRNRNFSTNGFIEGAVNIFKAHQSSTGVNTLLNLGNYWTGSSQDASTLAIDFRAGDGGGVTTNAPAGRIKVQTAYTTPFMDFDLGPTTVVRLQDGKVGIGTTNLDATLTVRGDVHSREVRVDMDGGVGPDYVFEKDYNLLPLPELEAYIAANKHLPEVPSAKEMEAHGLNLKEMNLLLLKKVEELTLHLIEQEKRDREQSEKIAALQAEFLRLKTNK